jgi:hypothetical protein
MRNTVTIALSALVILLLAIHARQRDREAILNGQMATLEKRLESRSRPAGPTTGEPRTPPNPFSPPPSGETPPPPPFKARPASPSSQAPSATPEFRLAVADLAQPRAILDLASKLEIDLVDLENKARSFIHARPVEDNGRLIYFKLHESPDLGLSDTQKLLLENLRQLQEAEAQVYRERLKQIEDRYRQAFHQILDAGQLEKYDAGPSRDGLIDVLLKHE